MEKEICLDDIGSLWICLHIWTNILCGEVQANPDPLVVMITCLLSFILQPQTLDMTAVYVFKPKQTRFLTMNRGKKKKEKKKKQNLKTAD